MRRKDAQCNCEELPYKHKASVIKNIKLSKICMCVNSIVLVRTSVPETTQSKSNMNNFAKEDQTKYHCILNVKHYVTQCGTKVPLHCVDKF